jgi:hypothetical protein
MSVSDEFMGAGGSSSPAFRFENPGDTVSGVVTKIAPLDDKDPHGVTKVWPDGKAKKVYVFELDTPQGPQSVWVRNQMVKTVRDAGRAAGFTSLIGCNLTVKFTGYGEQKTKGYQQPKLYAASVKAGPAPAFSADELVA